MPTDFYNVAFLPRTPVAGRTCACGKVLAAHGQSCANRCAECGRCVDTGTTATLTCTTCWERTAIIEIRRELPNGSCLWLPVCATCARNDPNALRSARPIKQLAKAEHQ